MEYRSGEIEIFARELWQKNNVYEVKNNNTQPKFYILDMFPYPSGAGLHVGHPLGYIASDIYARYKKMKGFNVLHPMGFDAFGLPAEQYALETGQHPAHTTEQNIARYKEQLNNIGFNYDWSREVRTSDPQYYKWTQWIFLQLFESWFNKKKQKAEPLSELIAHFEKEGNAQHPSPTDEDLTFEAAEWKQFEKKEQNAILMQYRLAYLAQAEVWWCEALNTVLANDEVVNGVSERGGHPVEKRKLKQWFLRITEFADRLLMGMENLDWTESMKEMQRNWIGKSEGALVKFGIRHPAGDGKNAPETIEVFTTRPDTIYGVDFMVLAPEHDWILDITTDEQRSEVEKYIAYVKSRSERERMSEKKITGVFTGTFAIHPLNGKLLPIWISEYVLAGYGTGAIMAVPSGDERDLAFAKTFNLSVTNIFGEQFNGENAIGDKQAILQNSDFLSNLNHEKAMPLIIEKLAKLKVGKRKINFKLRDAGFSRQRYWGEPFPIAYNIDDSNGPESILAVSDAQNLPVTLPHVNSYKPGPEGEGPLANLRDWVFFEDKQTQWKRETNTMPGYAGSSWYFLRYMDPNNNDVFASPEATAYWNQVDIYIGGTEHAVGHLLYSRMWTKVLHDLGHLNFDEPFKKLVNQGMIQGSSRFVYRVSGSNKFVSFGLIKNYPSIDKIHVDVNIVDGNILNQDAFKNFKNGAYATAEFELENGVYICGSEIEKMSKSKYNVVNPDDIVAQYGADTFRMYEMFLGPIEMSKPWDTKGIEGVYRFIKKLWRLFYDEQDLWIVETGNATEEAKKILHKTIKKITEDIERFSFNTTISQFMICVNELSQIKCRSSEILDPLVRLIAPFAPHTAEFLYHQLGHKDSVILAAFPVYDEKYLIENEKTYPVAINGKTRTELTFALDADAKFVEEKVLENETVQKWLEGRTPKKVIYVKGRMINVVM